MVELTLATLFQDALTSTSTHRRTVASAKRQVLSCLQGGRESQMVFCDTFKQCIFVLLSLKKGTAGVDRVLKFVRGFLSMMTDENDAKAQLLNPMGSYLIEFMMYHLSKGFSAKDKNVRFRVCQMTTLFLEFLEEADDELVSTFIQLLYARTFDKEASVRAQAVAALSILLESGDAEDNQKNANRLLEMLQYDPSGEVRKAAMWNLPLAPEMLSYLIQRTRDIDPSVRRSVYLRLSDASFEMKLMEKQQRTELLKNGLYDRNQAVKKACLKFLCEKWVGNSDIFDLLATVDIDDPSCTEAAIKSYFMSKPDVQIRYDETVWDNLNAQTAFLLRVYILYCSENKLLDQLENVLPSVLKHVELLAKHSQKALAEDADEETKIAEEFVFGQLLLMAQHQDYTDELGRREMVRVMRTFMVALDLPEDILCSVAKTIRYTSTSDSDFLNIMVEALYDAYDEDQENNTAADELEKAMKLLKCLDLIKAMLLHMEKSCADEATLNGIIDTFISPAVRSSNDLLCQQALNCLALAFLLDGPLAKKKLNIFGHAFMSEKPEYQMISLKACFDLVTFYGIQYFDDEDCTLKSLDILAMFKRGLESVDQQVLTLTVEGLSKLFLFKHLEDFEVMQVLVISYFHPSTANFLRLRQCLNYFFQVFAHSSFRNQVLLLDCLLPAVDFLGEQGLSLTMVQQMLDWVDVEKLVNGMDDARVRCLHDQFAEQALVYCSEHPEQNATKLLVQAFASLKLPTSTKTAKKKLMLLADDLKNIMGDQPGLKKLMTKLQQGYDDGDDHDEDEMDEHPSSKQ